MIAKVNSKEGSKISLDDFILSKEETEHHISKQEATQNSKSFWFGATAYKKQN